MIVKVSSNGVVDPANEGKLVYIKGRVEVNEPLTEPEYGVTILAVKLKRRVQMYQWVEENEDPNSWFGVNIDEGLMVSYTTAWKDKLVDSSLFIKPFGHANPKSFPVESTVSMSETVKVGAYTLSQELKDHFNSFILLTSDQRPERRDIKMHSGLYYHSFDVWNPEVGDTRVQLSYAGSSDDVVTILARQVGATLQPYYTEIKDLTSVIEGEHTLSAILSSKFPSTGVWLTRVFAYFAAYCAYSSLTCLLSKAGNPSRISLMCLIRKKSLLCHTFSAATILLVLGITWFAYSPLVGFINLLGSFTLISYCLLKFYSFYMYLNR